MLPLALPLVANLPTVFKIAQVAMKIVSYIQVAAQVIGAVANKLGVLQDGQRAEDFGYAMRNAKKSAEEFSTINEYFAYLNDEIKAGNIDMSGKREMIDIVAGNALVAQAICGKLGLETSPEFWDMLCKKAQQERLDSNEAASILEICSKTNVSLQDITSYINNTELSGEVSASDVSSTIESALQEAHPERSQTDIADRFNDLLKKD